MRPDEHKKKRSAQYQKKHGKETKSGKSKEKGAATPGPSHKEKTSTSTCSSQGVRDRHQHQSASGDLKNRSPADLTGELTSSDSGDSDSERVKPEERKPFRRRQIVSNWSKYDVGVVEEKETPTQKGDDFFKLLGMAGDSSAQFRFQDEVGWEEDLALQTTEYLSLNTESLASSLQCLPLHQRLGLDENLFTADQITQMMEEAASQQKSYLPSVQCASRSVPQGATLSSLSGLLEAEDEYLDSPENTNASPETGNSCATTKPSMPKTDSVNDSVNQKTLEKTVIRQISIEHSQDMSNFETDYNNEKKETLLSNRDLISSQEDELEFLLSLDSPQVPDSEVSVSPTQSRETAMVDPRPPVVDENKPKSGLSKTTASPQSTGKTTEDLEDWLDSVLDD